MKRIETGGFIFEFNDVLDAFVFDEADAAKATYHGVSHALQAVDILVESADRWYFIEVKDFRKLGQHNQVFNENDLRKKLKYKFRDTYLYRHAEGKITKPIVYICLLAHLDNALCAKMHKDLSIELPIGRPTLRWNTELAQGCIVLNVDRWNQNFMQWQIRPIS